MYVTEIIDYNTGNLLMGKPVKRPVSLLKMSFFDSSFQFPLVQINHLTSLYVEYGLI